MKEEIIFTPCELIRTVEGLSNQLLQTINHQNYHDITDAFDTVVEDVCALTDRVISGIARHGAQTSLPGVPPDQHTTSLSEALLEEQAQELGNILFPMGPFSGKWLSGLKLTQPEGELANRELKADGKTQILRFWQMSRVNLQRRIETLIILELLVSITMMFKPANSLPAYKKSEKRIRTALTWLLTRSRGLYDRFAMLAGAEAVAEALQAAAVSFPESVVIDYLGVDNLYPHRRQGLGKEPPDTARIFGRTDDAPERAFGRLRGD